MPGFQVKFLQRMCHGGIVQVSRHFVREIAQQVVFVPFLPNGRFVKKHGPAAGPQQPLCDKAAPDIGHAETAIGRQVEQQESFRKPGSVLAVEGAPGAFAQCYRGRRTKIHREFPCHTKHRVNIGIFIGKSLLDRSKDGLSCQGKRRCRVVDRLQGQPTRPKLVVGIIVIRIHPAFSANGECLNRSVTWCEERVVRKIIIIRFDDAVAFPGQQVAQIFARVVFLGKNPRQPEVERVLLLDGYEPATR